MIRRTIKRSLESWAKCPVHFFVVVKSSINVRELAKLVRSPEDEATYAGWWRGSLIFYGGSGLAFAAVIAAHLFGPIVGMRVYPALNAAPSDVARRAVRTAPSANEERVSQRMK
jgi:hypothetical protein